MSALGFKVHNPDFEARVRASFGKQTIMGLLGRVRCLRPVGTMIAVRV